MAQEGLWVEESFIPLVPFFASGMNVVHSKVPSSTVGTSQAFALSPTMGGGGPV